MTKVLTTRVDQKTAFRIQEASTKAKKDKSAFLRTLLEKGLREFEEEQALEQYKKNEISLGKLADMLEITKWDALDLLAAKQILVQYDEKDMVEDMEEDPEEISNYSL